MAEFFQEGTSGAELDLVRQEKGIDTLKSHFQQLLKSNRKKAIELINDQNLNFCTLYILHTAIVRSGNARFLNNHNFNALRMAYSISEKRTKDIDLCIKNQNKPASEILKYIVCTGYTEDGLDNRYDEILELAAALLIRYYNDDTVLPVVSDMIFKRYKKGALIHNLVWAFFEARNPDSLLLLAHHLYSQDRKDYELACRLLGFIPYVESNRYTNNAKMYYEVSQWIQENSMFLYHTEECLHLTANPIPYVLSAEAKYLCKPVSPNDGKPFRDFSDDEEMLLNQFKALDAGTRMQLAGFSYMLYRRNMHQWNEWIHFPIHDQLRTMKMAMGGRM